MDYVSHEPDLDGTLGPNVFALWVNSVRMEPAFPLGELVLVDRRRRAAPGNDVIAYVKSEAPGDKDETMIIRRLLSRDADTVRLEQYNPYGILDIPRGRITRLYRVMTLADLLFPPPANR